ncbi:MAG: SDR family NAD(P)-dependent oxidoreductase [Pseudomonadota bacterium]
MTKTILLTGATDGIGLEAAKRLVAAGHTVLLHGRSTEKLATAVATVNAVASGVSITTYRADLSDLREVQALAQQVQSDGHRLDAIINNAGVFKTSTTTTAAGLDTRFVVNTIAPYLLTALLLPSLADGGRVVNVSSAAQASVDLAALRGERRLGDSEAYAQSKLAITMWTRHLAAQLGSNGPVIVAVNPASLLGSKMVQEAYGIAGGDIGVGADMLIEAALSPRFAEATGQYYDNDNRVFADPHRDALDATKNAALVDAIEGLIGAAGIDLAPASYS